ncbi:MAG: type II toxin-antitoxin system PemK/MazF family toxin [Candidatus Stahlbacteria bacterium]|nr:type II toxin-antitoxin system PemK/MazF family toxin [Candidatus Stahlbacteria bacterium]
MVNLPLRGEIYWVNLEPTIGTEIKKTRPCLIVSCDQANENYNHITVLPLTSKHIDRIEPFQVFLSVKETGLEKDSKALAEQIRTVSKLRLIKKAGLIRKELIAKIESAIKLHLDLE